MGGIERPIAVFISRVREEWSYIAQESYLLDAILRQQQAYFAVDFEARAVDTNDDSVPSHVPSRLAATSPKDLATPAKSGTSCWGALINRLREAFSSASLEASGIQSAVFLGGAMTLPRLALWPTV